jgi:hypothetical protein
MLHSNKMYLNGLSAVFSGEVEGASAVEVVDQIDAGGGRCAGTGNTVVDVFFAVLSGVT